MSIVTNFSDIDLTKQYSYSDYLLWQFSERVELIRGFVKKMSPAPSRYHQVVSQNLSGLFYLNFRKHSCDVYVAPFDVRLPIKSKKKDTTVVQPDLCVVCDKSKLDDAGCNGAPDLMIEILSPNSSKHDLDTKFKLYEEAGVLEYWIVNPADKNILIYILQDGKFTGTHPLIEEDTIKSPLFPQLDFCLEEVFN